MAGTVLGMDVQHVDWVLDDGGGFLVDDYTHLREPGDVYRALDELLGTTAPLVLPGNDSHDWRMTVDDRR